MILGTGRIELPPYPPHGQILPLYYVPPSPRLRRARPLSPEANFIGAPRIELGPYAPKAYILPLYYAPPSPRLRRASPLSPKTSLVIVFRGCREPPPAGPGGQGTRFSRTFTPLEIFFSEWGESNSRLTNPRLPLSFRGAGNRTRFSRTRSVYTTGVLHPGSGNGGQANRVYCHCTTLRHISNGAGRVYYRCTTPRKQELSYHTESESANL